MKCCSHRQSILNPAFTLVSIKLFQHIMSMVMFRVNQGDSAFGIYKYICKVWKCIRYTWLLWNKVKGPFEISMCLPLTNAGKVIECTLYQRHASFSPVEIFVSSCGKCIIVLFSDVLTSGFISRISLIRGNVVMQTKLQNSMSHILQNNGVTIWTLPHKWSKFHEMLCTQPLQCAMELFNP